MLTLAELRNKDLKTLQAELGKARQTLLMSKMNLKLKQDKKSHVKTQQQNYIAHIEMVMKEMSAAPAEKN